MKPYQLLLKKEVPLIGIVLSICFAATAQITPRATPAAYPSTIKINYLCSWDAVAPEAMTNNLTLSAMSDKAGGVSDALSNGDTYSYYYQNYSVRSPDNKLIETAETFIDQNDINKSVTNHSRYHYDSISHQQVTRIKTTDSSGDTILISKKYPLNFPLTAPYNTMIALNNINKLVEEARANATKNTQLNFQRTHYNSYSGNNYLPQNIQLQLKTNPIETIANFISYDLRGNPQELQKTLNVKQSFIWDYQNVYPIAEVTNSGQSDIAYTSFESVGKGNWTFSGAPYIDASAPTGKRIYNLFYGAISRSINSNIVYTLSFWAKAQPVGKINI